MRGHVILALQFFLWLVGLGMARPCYSPSPSPIPPKEKYKWYSGRYFFFSDKAPMIEVLRNVDGFVENADRALDTLEKVEGIILEQLSTSSRRSSHRKNSRSGHLKLCDLQDKQWRYAAQDQIELRFPVKSRIDCVTDFIADQKDQEELHRIIFKFNKMVMDNAVAIASHAGTNFTDADTIFNYPFETATQTCRVNALGAYRWNNTWYLNVGITNENKEKHLGDFDRFYLVETMSRGGGYGLMRLPLRAPDGAEEETRQFVSNTTTIIVAHRSTAEPAFFKAVFLSENVAVVRATYPLEQLMQQVSDALSPSSITVLFFPLWLNLIPIAMLADVSSATMLIYTLLSDVLTTLPLAIKGVELIWIGSRGSIGTVVRMSSGFSGERAPTAASEVETIQAEGAEGNVPPEERVDVDEWTIVYEQLF
ncbi:unnamed protein product [Agarophyton chilense]